MNMQEKNETHMQKYKYIMQSTQKMQYRFNCTNSMVSHGTGALGNDPFDYFCDT
jgi:hypothetical protein